MRSERSTYTFNLHCLRDECDLFRAEIVKVLSTYFGWLRINFNKDFNRFYIIAGNTAYQHSSCRLRLENTE